MYVYVYNRFRFAGRGLHGTSADWSYCRMQRRHGTRAPFARSARVRLRTRVRCFKLRTNLNEAIAQRHFLMLPFISATVEINKNREIDRESYLTHNLVCGIIPKNCLESNRH